MTNCDYCKTRFKPTREGQRFCTTPGKNCRQKWHQENTLPGTVKIVRQIKGGKWSVTIHYPVQPRTNIGASVALETIPSPRPDASSGDNSIHDGVLHL